MFLCLFFFGTFWRECYVWWFLTDLVSQKVATSFTALSLPLVRCGNAQSILTLALLLCPLSFALTVSERNCEINLPVFHYVLQLSQTLIMNIWLTLLFHHYLISILVPAKLGPFFLHLWSQSVGLFVFPNCLPPSCSNEQILALMALKASGKGSSTPASLSAG